MELLSNMEYSANLNDVWAWVAEDGTEYAMVGAANGVSIVSLADPTNPVENDFIPGVNSTWRDLKVHGNFGYCIADQGNDGLLIMDLSHLPDSVDYIYLTNYGAGIINRAHNLYIDEGILYVSGSNQSFGGVIAFDLTDPWSPEFLGNISGVYSHDIYVRDNIVYSSEIYEGNLAIYDANDFANITKIGQSATPFNYTHNAWLSDDSNFIFTTDELSNAPVASYDVSDLSNIVKLDEYRPSSSLDLGIVPHNVHVLNDFLVISYYSDGIRVVDASDPSNLVEVANYDTYEGFVGATFGCWGAYPFLPSGIILGTDMVYGLFVLAPDYKRASYLNGTVIDSETGLAISNASIRINEANEITYTNILGEFSTGTANEGSYTVTASKIGYLPQTFEVSFASEETAVANFELETAQSFAFSGQVITSNNGSPLAEANIVVANDQVSIEIQADENGYFSIPEIFENDYFITAGKWAYKTVTVDLPGVNPDNNSTIVELVQGYEDPFLVDLGWEVSGNANSGNWERAIPGGTFAIQFLITPPEDSQNDIGNRCFVTDNAVDFGNGVIGGTTILTSPTFDLSSYTEAVINYERWFISMLPAQNFIPGNDTLKVLVSNGSETVLLEKVDMSDFDGNPAWVPASFQLDDLIAFSDSMQLRFEVRNTNADIVEAAVDNFKIEGNFEIEYECFISDFDFSNIQSESICDGEVPNPPQAGLDYSLLGTATLLDGIKWFLAEDPNSEMYNLEPLTHSGTDLCTAETIHLYAYSQCDIDVDGTADSWILVAQHEVVIHPEIQSPTISGEGEFTVNANCANDVTDITTFSLPAGTPSGTMSITVSQEGNTCTSKTFEVAHDAVPDITGMEDLADANYEIQVYPNPFSESFKIITDKYLLTNNAELIIVNTFGQEVYRQTINPQVGQLNASFFSINATNEMVPGIYFIQIIERDKKSAMQKIIKM